MRVEVRQPVTSFEPCEVISLLAVDRGVAALWRVLNQAALELYILLVGPPLARIAAPLARAAIPAKAGSTANTSRRDPHLATAYSKSSWTAPGMGKFSSRYADRWLRLIWCG